VPQLPRRQDEDVWIPTAIRLGLVIIYRDKRVRYRRAEVGAFRQCGARAFVLGVGKNLKVWDQLVVLVRHWPRIEEVIAQAGGGPWIYSITQANVAPLRV
jgi:hypothetical protein